MTQETILRLAQGNPGAASFLIDLEHNHEKTGLGSTKAFVILSKINHCPSIRGSAIYVLWNDLCERDYEKCYKLCRNCPDEVLTDACLRQDYSGKELVADYLE